MSKKGWVEESWDVALLGKLIRKKREEAGLRAIELARHMGVAVQAVSNWENGHAALSAINLIKLCLLLGCDFMTFKEAFKFEVKETQVTKRTLVWGNEEGACEPK
jgi:transcriptional regulator with XRE-family HTH domain